MTKTGILYGIGVGPGDPELLTLKAVRILGEVDVIFAAASTKNDYSTAYAIARPHLKKGVQVIQLGFPMTKDAQELDTAWKANAEIVAKVLDKGMDAAFLTLGDPLTYSTYGYLQRTLLSVNPNLHLQAVPGITSFHAAASKIGLVLVESKESLLITSGVADIARLEEQLDSCDNAVILKAYKNFDEIRDLLTRLRLADKTVLVSRLGMDDESILMDIKDAPKKPHYFSLALVKKNKT
ncbi:precorrin-2 C(20)-methyltransferase [Pseudodesulfovibrio sp. S3]|uniref:precorrin-2 C(20)-methyltransferase n=1 Tax=unclassified Pseudodesulfovibrio TaxID=2661612 RepID=UPI000FEB8603|nr:precorrin-2 C(20)-methyltransferase [Pseudodesulfovibrio sp. S3]MCJ2163001.1 precorrin-2 C(20)-methyltransferase [Pseudodesulfovibrio sp. S3-i]RWU06997.1 precorrin-2 C(20)-methyltransferase [Pseudodesulfovibrio sp. S3]